MTEARILNLPTEVQLALEVMPCQAMRQVYEPGAQPHPCAYFEEWGRYHNYDYATADPPDRPGIEAQLVYAGKTTLVLEILSGCRKAPIMAVGINPNLPGYWPSSTTRSPRCSKTFCGTVALSDCPTRAGRIHPPRSHGAVLDARFVMVLHGGCGASFAALGHGEDVLHLSLDPPVKLWCEGCRIGVDALRPGRMGLV
jgi:hypothetical protein